MENTERKVEIKDYDREVHHFIVILGMIGITMRYQLAELILMAQKELKRKPTTFSIDDAINLKFRWEKGWDDFFDLKDQDILYPDKTKISDWIASRKQKISGKLNNLLLHNKESPFKYIEDITQHEFLRLRGAGKGTWEEFLELKDES
jgi:hypothetical protein